MSYIFPLTDLTSRLAGSYNATKAAESAAKATSFVNSHTCRSYYTWDNYDPSTDLALAPLVISDIAIQVAVAIYKLATGYTTRDGNDDSFYSTLLESKKQELLVIDVSPTIHSQEIVLNAVSKTMIIGYASETTGLYPKVIPSTVTVLNGSTYYYNKFDFSIRKGMFMGKVTQGENPDAWYIVSRNDLLAGIITYQRSYRLDSKDFMRYSND